MNCKVFHIELERLESPTALPPEMQTHAAICSACRQHFASYRQMLAVLETDAPPVLPADFNAKVLARLAPAFASASAPILSWKRLFIYGGYVCALGLALWFGFKNFDWSAVQQILHSPAAQQMQQWLTALGVIESLQAFQRFVISVLSLAKGFVEKAFGAEALPRAINLTLMLLLTFMVAKVSVFIESWLRQMSRRSS